MLKIECLDHYNNVRAFAKERGLEDKLQVQLDYLGGYACHNTEDRPADYTVCALYSDFAPHSFSFVMYTKSRRDDGEVRFDGLPGSYQRWFNGGLIYYGAGDSGVCAPQFSVRLNNENEGWEVHT